MENQGGEDVLEWLSSQNLSGMKGLWIVAYRKRIVAKAPSLEQALADAKLPPGSVPFVMRVPLEELIVA